MNIRQKKLPIAALERIDDLCADFERKWRSGEAASIDSFLTEQMSTAEREALLAELIVLEFDYRQMRGESPSAKEYIDRFPGNAALIEDALKDGDKKTGTFEPPTIAQLSDLFPALQIIEFVGAGGMGAVYKARQEGLDRVVALKILPEEFGHDVKFALRFTREARTLAKLSHPNIVSVFEFGNVNDTYYFLMEFVDGSTLRDVVMARKLAPEHALAIVPHLCDALQYAHDKGVVHRDIKPENILMAADGSVKIADFGLSRILGHESQQDQLTGTHQIMGTPRYMAPEQFEGSHRVDHRADIYSLGVVFYEMLTGELPIGRFAPPSEKVEIDVRLDEVVMRTLEKEPKRRYQSASQIKSDVQSITSKGDPAANTQTFVANSNSKVNKPPLASVEQQELAGRLLLTRRQLMERVEAALRPMFGGQFFKVLFGVALIVLGVKCWALNLNVPHRVVCGVVLHIYGILVISQGALVYTKLKKIDYSKPVDDIRSKLDSLRVGYLRAGIIIGFVWWIMWIPAAVALGFDLVMHPNSVYLSLIVGVVGFAVSVWLYWRVLASGTDTGETWRMNLSGERIKAAYAALDEIESAQIH